MCGVQPNGDTKTDLLQRDVAKMTFEEGRRVIFENAKATVGAAKVQQICEAMVQLFFFRVNLAEYAGSSLSGRFAPVRFALLVDHRGGPQDLVLRIPNTDSKDLRSLLSSNVSLFEWEMRMRGFQLTASSYDHCHWILSIFKPGECL